MFFAAENPLEGAFCEIKVLEIGKLLKDGFPDVEGLRAPGPAGQLLKAFFDGLC